MDYLNAVLLYSQMMQANLRGELSCAKNLNLQEYDLIDAVARSLHISSPNELSQLGETLFPAMLNAAILEGNTKKIDTLKSHGANLSSVNCDQRTALHIACCEGDVNMVKHLLAYGVSVHIRDRYDRTALMEAISTDNRELIKLLVQCGAHMTGSARGIGEQLCSVATRGYLKRLESYRLAGADLSQPDASGRTALHMACLHGHMDVVQFLLRNHVEKNANDALGLSPLDYATRGGQTNVVEYLLANGVSSSPTSKNSTFYPKLITETSDSEDESSQ